MRAILLLMVTVVVTIGCGGKSPNQFELDIAVDAPQAAGALVDGTVKIAAAGGVYSRGYPTVADAAQVHGTIATLNADGGVRASTTYQYGTYCAGSMPLLRQTNHFAEGSDASGALQLTLQSVECEKTDGTGIVVTP
jgi:hypothetical protein